jgi:phosphoribosylamine--glycine ligase
LKVLIVGSGGREHALAWKVKQSRKVSHVFVAPGNGGTATMPGVSNIDLTNIHDLAAWAKQNDIDLTIVGGETTLAEGIVDHFNANGLACFGPTKAAAQLESSKSFCKDFLRRYDIPTANYHKTTDPAQAKAIIRNHKMPVVIKASGIAAGKGVIIAATLAEAEAAIDELMIQKKLGTAADEVVIEEFLEGEELSFIVLCAKDKFVNFASSQDHKRRDNGDNGPNTGGMGAYSPAPCCTEEIKRFTEEKVIKPTLNGMIAEGTPFTGFLYAGLMLTNDGPKVLEFNCRLGDPETQVILPRLESDLVSLIIAALAGELDRQSVTWSEQVALGVILAAHGYPEAYNKGKKISGIDSIDNGCLVFQAGTKIAGDTVVTNGGRVLCVTALAANTQQAFDLAYKNVTKIDFEGCFYRSDIGYRALKHS